MSNFHTRMANARKWEVELCQRLRDRGWVADLFGQGQLTEYWRTMLTGYRDSYGRPTLVRWMPDIIAAREGDPASLAFIDAKTGMASTGNYSVEINAHQAARAFENLLYIPVFFVWEDGGVLSTHTIENRRFNRHDGGNTNGSGTAFYLIRKQFATTFKQQFTAPINAFLPPSEC